VSLWLTVVAIGVATYGIRLSMLVFVHHSTLPDAVRSALRFVQPAVLAAIIAPAVLYAGERDAFDAGPGNERLVAALLAALIAWRTKSVWLTIAAGMGVLWLLQWTN